MNSKRILVAALLIIGTLFFTACGQEEKDSVSKLLEEDNRYEQTNVYELHSSIWGTIYYHPDNEMFTVFNTDLDGISIYIEWTKESITAYSYTANESDSYLGIDKDSSEYIKYFEYSFVEDRYIYENPDVDDYIILAKARVHQVCISIKDIVTDRLITPDVWSETGFEIYYRELN